MSSEVREAVHLALPQSYNNICVCNTSINIKCSELYWGDVIHVWG